MLHKGAFDLERPDPVPGTFNEVVGPSHEPVISVFVAPGHISRAINCVPPNTRRTVRLPVVSVKNPNRHSFSSANHNLSCLSDATGIAIVVKNVDVIPR